jgi:hypothetical protein
MSLKAGQRVRVSEFLADAKNSGWPRGEIGFVVIPSTHDALIHFPGATEGHSGEALQEASNTEHWWVWYSDIIELGPLTDSLVTEMVKDYVQDVQGR